MPPPPQGQPQYPGYPPPAQGAAQPQPHGPRPGPYGPPQPGPYGPGQPAPHGPGQPGPYGPPPQGGPYGPPPGSPYGQGQTPFPQQGGWAPPPAPPKKFWSGPKAAVVGVSVAVAVAVLAWAGNRGGGSGAFPEATHKVALPKTLLGGEYALAQDLSEQGDSALAGASEANIRDPKGVVGQYTSAGAKQGGVLVLSALYGRIKDPDDARESMLKGAAESEGATVAVPPKDIEVPGSDVTVTCQVLTAASAGGKSSFPMCAWADENTNGSVAEVDPEAATGSPESVDLRTAAANTLKVREEVRQPID